MNRKIILVTGLAVGMAAWCAAHRSEAAAAAAAAAEQKPLLLAPWIGNGLPGTIQPSATVNGKTAVYAFLHGSTIKIGSQETVTEQWFLMKKLGTIPSSGLTTVPFPDRIPLIEDEKASKTPFEWHRGMLVNEPATEEITNEDFFKTIRDGLLNGQDGYARYALGTAVSVTGQPPVNGIGHEDIPKDADAGRVQDFHVTKTDCRLSVFATPSRDPNADPRRKMVLQAFSRVACELDDTTKKTFPLIKAKAAEEMTYGAWRERIRQWNAADLQTTYGMLSIYSEAPKSYPGP